MKNKILLVTITIFAVAALSVLILHACRTEDQEEVTQTKEVPVQEEFVVTKVKPIKHVTTIRVSKDGMFEYEKGLIRIYPGDTVTWICDTEKKGPFTIHIGWDSPFEKCSFHSKNGEDIKATLPEDARPGYYRYMIAVLVDGIIYTDDPELIVKRPGGRG